MGDLDTYLLDDGRCVSWPSRVSRCTDGRSPGRKTSASLLGHRRPFHDEFEREHCGRLKGRLYLPAPSVQCAPADTNGRVEGRWTGKRRWTSCDGASSSP